MMSIDPDDELSIPFASCADLDGLNIVFPEDADARTASGFNFIRKMAATFNPMLIHYWVLNGSEVIQEKLRIAIEKKVIARSMKAPPVIRERLDREAIEAVFQIDGDHELDRQLFVYLSSVQRLTALTERARGGIVPSPARQRAEMVKIFGVNMPIKETAPGEEAIPDTKEELLREIFAWKPLVEEARKKLNWSIQEKFRQNLRKIEETIPEQYRASYLRICQATLREGAAIEFCMPPVLSVTPAGEPQITIFPWTLAILQRVGAIHINIDMSPIKDSLANAAANKPFFLRMAFGMDQFTPFHLDELQQQGLLPLMREALTPPSLPASRNGKLSLNEARAAAGLPAIPGGDGQFIDTATGAARARDMAGEG